MTKRLVVLASAMVTVLFAAVPANAVATVVDGRTQTVVQGSDSLEVADRAHTLWFSDDEILEYNYDSQVVLLR
ncbi:hypothetical protein ACFYUJ_28620 [Streptomyces sp. NPDC004520]|uniref:hypothetical protein n=1 Tax=Streptomyces sp. NPDC004520 TaxID=3364702 RepID=UPI0036CBE286